MHVLKVQSWGPSEAQSIIEQRLIKAKMHRENNFEAQWRANESMLFKPSGDSTLNPTLSYSSLAEVYAAKSSAPSPGINTPKVAQNLRFLHSQMSANPPSVIPQATSNEHSDKQAARAADHLLKFGKREYKIQENIDLTSLSTLTYGTGFIKLFHDPTAGKQPLKFEEGSDEITMPGDFKARPRLIWNLWVDPDADVWDDVRYIFERHIMPAEEALSRWPEYRDIIMNNLVDTANHPSRISSLGKAEGNVTDTRDEFHNAMVEIYEYTEKGLPTNGMAGRRCFHIEDGTLLGDMSANPHPEAILPYGILTDIDVPGEVYGKTTVDYALGLSRVVDALDNMVLNNIELHGSIKLVVFDQAETNKDDFSDDPVDIITVNGTHAHAPYQLKPASVTSDVYSLRAQLLESIDGIMGVNEILQGQLNRELSGFASQTAINAANMVRHRLFYKYTALVEFVYWTYLMSVRDNWKTRRVVSIVGPEDQTTVEAYQGADIASGYVLYVEYGTNFSLDPAMRREEIMQSKDIMVEAGISPKKIVEKLRYNEFGDIFDAVEAASKRQMEIFDEAIKKYEKTGNVDIEPANVMRKAYHLEMAEAAMEYVMTKEFLNLDAELREGIYNHIDEREALAAEQAAPPAEGQPGQPPMAGPPGMPPMGMPPMPDIGGVL